MILFLFASHVSSLTVGEPRVYDQSEKEPKTFKNLQQLQNSYYFRYYLNDKQKESMMNKLKYAKSIAIKYVDFMSTGYVKLGRNLERYDKAFLIKKQDDGSFKLSTRKFTSFICINWEGEGEKYLTGQEITKYYNILDNALSPKLNQEILNAKKDVGLI